YTVLLGCQVHVSTSLAIMAMYRTSVAAVYDPRVYSSSREQIPPLQETKRVRGIWKSPYSMTHVPNKFPEKVPRHAADQIIGAAGECVAGAEPVGIDKITCHQRPCVR